MTLKNAVRSARQFVRHLRGVPILGAGVRAIDTLHWFRVVLSSGLVDPEFYSSQRCRRATPAWWAAAHYVSIGFRAGRSPNPLFDELHSGSQLPDHDRVPALYAYLVSDRVSVSVHPWWRMDSDDPRTLLAEVWSGPRDRCVTLRVGPNERRVTVDQCRRQAIASGRLQEMGERAAGPQLVIRHLASTDRGHATKVGDAVETGSTVLVICPPQVVSGAWASLALAVLGAPSSLTVSRSVAGSDIPAGGKLSAVAVIEDDVQISGDDLRDLLERARTSVAAPLVIGPTGTISSCGWVAVPTAAGPRPYRFLSDHPIEDAAPFRVGVTPVSRVDSSVFAFPWFLMGEGEMVTEDIDVESLCSRARHDGVEVIVCGELTAAVDPTRARTVDPLAVEHAAVVPGVEHGRAEELLAAAGFGVSRWVESGATEIVPLLRRTSRRQRWAIKSSAPAGTSGRAWGDAHFARGLASALRRRGHEVVIDAYPASARRTTYLDDVHVVIRGPFPIDPPEGGVSVEWIISHPDEITRDEVTAFDLVFAVSRAWAEHVTKLWGVSVEPLLECTDSTVFYPRGLTRTTDVVFVGTARGIARPAVVVPLSAGIDIKVYGPDWRGFIPAQSIAGTHIPNESLGAVYERASVVLNDHWPAMRREGFMAMRPFDVVASGGRVISERIDGMKQIFQGAVVEFDTERELVELLRSDLDSLFPSETELRRISESIRSHHSFDKRAEELDEAVQRFLGEPRLN